MVASGGDLRAGLVGGVTAGMFYGVGELYGPGGQFAGMTGPERFASKVVLHGTVGGVSQDALGGQFKHGFLSAGFAEAATLGGVVRSIGGPTGAGQMAVAAIIGGTASSIGGGKFGNGAVTAAFSYGFGKAAARQAQQNQNRAGDPLPDHVIDELSPYFPDLNLTQIRVRDGIPRFVVGDPDAFTLNNDIYFAPGAYDPNSASGIALIGHEVLHVQQFQQFGTARLGVRYFGEYAAGRLSGLNHYQAYRNISFERDAFALQRRIFNDLRQSGWRE